MASVMRARCRPGWVLLAGGAIVMSISGCLWKDDVNELPLVVITGPKAIHVGGPAEFTARFTTPESGEMFDWRKEATCPADLAEAEQSLSERKTGATISWPLDAETPESERVGFCVFVIATDSLGAKGFQKHEVTLVDRRVVISVPAQVTSGKPAKYTARFSDDPAAAASAQFFWASSVGNAQGDPACVAAETGAQESYVANATNTVSRDTAEWEDPAAARRPYCVAVIARDKFGARYRGQQMVSNIVNGGPPAKPRIVTPKEMPIGIFSRVRVAAAQEGELTVDDRITFDWKVKRMDGTAVPFAPCEGVAPANSEICFEVTAAGDYVVDLATTEGLQMATGSHPFTVEDRPPCIRMTQPVVLDNGAATTAGLDREEKALRVGQVVDDGDPWPAVGRASEGAFSWGIRPAAPDPTAPPASFMTLPHAIFNSYSIPAGQYRLGDKIEVRVEYRDRVDVKELKTRDLSHCKETDLTCETKPGSGCYLRVGWKVLYL